MEGKQNPWITGPKIWHLEMEVGFTVIYQKRKTIPSNFQYKLSRTKPQHLNVPRVVLQIYLPNPLNPGVELRMKMWMEQRRVAMLQLHLSDEQFYCLQRIYGLNLWVIHSMIKIFWKLNILDPHGDPHTYLKYPLHHFLTTLKRSKSVDTFFIIVAVSPLEAALCYTSCLSDFHFITASSSIISLNTYHHSRQRF